VVCLLFTTASLAKAAEPIDRLFGIWTREDPRNHVLHVDEGMQRSPTERDTFGEEAYVNPLFIEK